VFLTSECGAAKKQLGVVVGVKNFVLNRFFVLQLLPFAPWQCSTTIMDSEWKMMDTTTILKMTSENKY
jgi:hypothetical protein